MPIYRAVVETTQDELEIALAGCYGRGAFSIEEQDLAGERVRLLAYFYDPVEGAEAVDESVDWQSVSEQPWVAIEVGERLWLAPPWLDADPPPGRLRLNYLRGQACGTGAHAATQLCLRAMDKHVSAGMSFLDVGAGSGILCVAADLLDADLVIGCDIDHYSMTVAAPHCPAPLFTGSLKSVRDTSFEFIAANVNATVLGYLADDLMRVAKPGGLVVGSGYEERDAATVRESLRSFELVEELAEGNWRAIVARKPRSWRL